MNIPSQIKRGIIWGLIMFFFAILFMWTEREVYTIKKLLIKLAVWLSAGLMYGYLSMKLAGWMDRKS
ncbi:MAG: hypothetical protein IT267_10155 [Saprospiraceae bacterium]|nr:hypothetical protein [Saprospiraceae bacterium]